MRIKNTGLYALLILVSTAFHATYGQLPEQPGVVSGAGQALIADTAAIDRLITEGIARAPQERDTAIARLSLALQQSGQAAYATGFRNSLRALLPLLNAAQRTAEKQALLARALYTCTHTKALLPVLPVVYNAIGKEYSMQENYDYAAKYYLLAITAARTYAPDFLSSVYSNYGGMLVNLAGSTGTDGRQGLTYLDKAEALAEKEQNANIRVTVLINKGSHFLHHKEYASSEAALQKALRLSREYGMSHWQQVSLLGLGNLFTELQQPERALPFLQQAMAMKDQNIDPFYHNAALTLLGKTYLALGDHHKARQFLEQSLEGAEQLHIGRDLIETHRQLATLYAGEDAYREAYRHQERFIALNDSLRSKDIAGNLQQLEVKYQSSLKDRELLQRQLFINRQQQQLAEKNILIAGVVGLALIIAMVAVLFYSRYRQRQQALLREEKIRALNALMEGEEKERIRLAQELHDGIGGMLAAINMHFNVLSRGGFADREGMLRIMDMVQDTTEEVRKTSHNLMPAALLRHNLSEALLYYCSYVSSTGGLHIDLDVHGQDTARIGTAHTIVVFRIVQELVQNIVRHARATHAIVDLALDEQDVVHLMVEDNGIGMNTEAAATGLGLENVRHRVRTLGGHFHIESKEGIGTTVTLKFKTATD